MIKNYYDDKMNLIESDFYYNFWQGDSVKAASRIRYYYDSNNNCIHENNSNCTNRYNAANLLIEESCHELRGFDSVGNPEVYIKAGKFDIITSYVYLYDEHKNWIRRIMYRRGKILDITHRVISYY